MSSPSIKKQTLKNINIKEKSNRPPQIKKAIVKGFTERAHCLCDKEHLKSELKNIEEIFVANSYPRQQIRNIMQEEKRKPNKEEN